MRNSKARTLKLVRSTARLASAETRNSDPDDDHHRRCQSRSPEGSDDEDQRGDDRDGRQQAVGGQPEDALALGGEEVQAAGEAQDAEDADHQGDGDGADAMHEQHPSVDGAIGVHGLGGGGPACGEEVHSHRELLEEVGMPPLR